MPIRGLRRPCRVAGWPDDCVKNAFDRP